MTLYTYLNPVDLYQKVFVADGKEVVKERECLTASVVPTIIQFCQEYPDVDTIKFTGAEDYVDKYILELKAPELINFTKHCKIEYIK